MKMVVGIDGGATRTRAVLADVTGRIRGIGVSGASNYGSVPKYKIQKHIKGAFLQVFENSDVSPQTVDGLFLGMAGVVSSMDREAIQQIIEDSEHVNTRKIDIDHDIRISLAGGLTGEEGIALIVGTGSSCYGRMEDGRDWMAGGWGHLLDDRGSAYDLARRGLVAVVRAADGRGQGTDLTGALMKQLEIDSIDKIMGRIYADDPSGLPMSKTEIASLANLVTKTANNGDEVAMQIIREGVDELVLMVKTVAEKLNFSSSQIPLVITGGTVTGSQLIKEKLQEHLISTMPEVKIEKPVLKPVMGSVLLALQMTGIDVDKNIIANMVETASELQDESAAFIKDEEFK